MPRHSNLSQHVFSLVSRHGRPAPFGRPLRFEAIESRLLLNAAPVARDNSGWYGIFDGEVLRVGSPPGITVTHPITAGATWRYLDTGIAPAVDWHSMNYDDSHWAEGPAPLGFGDNDEATVLSRGQNQVTHPTYYFRRAFNLALSADPITALTVRLLRDDGAVVYLNGIEIIRSNMPSGSIDHNTLATSTVGGAQETSEYLTFTLPRGLQPSFNVVAVEVHQVNLASADLSFDLQLTGTADLPAQTGVLIDDTDVDGDVLTAIVESPPAFGTLELRPNGSFTYTPRAGFMGQDSFTYRAHDGVVSSNVATVTIAVMPPRDPPHLPPWAENDNYTVDQGDLLITGPGNEHPPGLLFNDRDREGDPLVAVLETMPRHGTIALRPDGSFVYDSDEGFSGVDYFTYTAQSGNWRSIAATVTIMVRSDEATVETVYGDVDLDGRVGLRDLVLMRNRLGGLSSSWTDGDMSGDGTIDLADVALLSTNFGYGRGGVTSVAAPRAVVQVVGRLDTASRETVVTRDQGEFPVLIRARRIAAAVQLADAAMAELDVGESSGASRATTLFSRRRSAPRRGSNLG